MKCSKCGKAPGEHGVTLLRQNSKGEIGIWECESCNRLPVDKDLALDIAMLQLGKVPNDAHVIGGSKCTTKNYRNPNIGTIQPAPPSLRFMTRG